LIRASIPSIGEGRGKKKKKGGEKKEKGGKRERE